jgi:uncharacterized Rmd1/YagE family protein
MWGRATLRSWGRPTYPALKLALDFKLDVRPCVRALCTVRDVGVKNDGARKHFAPGHRLARDILSPECMAYKRFLQNRDARSSYASSSASAEVDMEDEVIVDAEVEAHEAAVERNIVGDGVCAAYCAHAPVPLRALARYFSRPITLDTPRGRVYSGPGETLTDAADVLRVPLVTQNNTVRVGSGMRGFPGPTQEAHAFFFRSGAVVFWGVPMSARRELFRPVSLLASETEGVARGAEDATHGTPPWTGDTRPEAFRRNLCDGIDSLSLATRSPPARMEDFEHEFEYFLDAARRDVRATFKNDRIYIPNLSNTDEVLALSYGLAQSVKLHMSEVALDALVKRTAVFPQELAENGRIRLVCDDDSKADWRTAHSKVQRQPRFGHPRHARLLLAAPRAGATPPGVRERSRVEVAVAYSECK